jgi:predicted Zn-dependent peptidase
MSMSRSASCVLILLVSVLSGAALGQQVKVEKYELPNGMTVILHEDHSLPIACVNTWYYVGSKDEPAGRSGFAHLFEHLMFMGTRRVPGAEFDLLMESGGGANNATTSEDRTNYFSIGPSALLPTLLWLDADRLEDLGKEMTQEKLDKQREVVRNERRQMAEMRPYGRAELKISELMYPPEHPYHHTVIGSHEDLQSATIQDVQDFFAGYYMPSNASLVVAGDFDPQTIKPLIAKLFGTLPRGKTPSHATAEPVRLDEVRRATFRDRVQFAKVYLVYHSPAHFKPGDAEMDLSASVLADGKSSRLYRRLVYEDKLATEVAARQESRSLGSTFTIEVTAREGVSLDEIERVIAEVLEDYRQQGPTSEELERHRARFEFQAVRGVQSLLEKADKLNQYQFSYGDPNAFQRDLDRYRAATTDGVRDWANRVLTPNGRLIMRVLPEEHDLASAREERPAAAAERAFSPEAPESFKLSNGLEVRHWRRSELPLVSVKLLVKAGTAEDDPPQAGRTYLMTQMLDEGAGARGALEFNDALDRLGAAFSASCSQESLPINLSVLKRNFDEALSLYADAILRPQFDEREWQRVKALHLAELKQAADRPDELAVRVGMREFFGVDHPYGRPADGTINSVEALSIDDIRDAHQQLLDPANAVLFIAGDLTADEARTALERALGSWKAAEQKTHGASVASAASTRNPANESLKVIVVDKPGSVQTVIRFYLPAPAYRNPQRVQRQLLNTILGGSFTSRLNQNLREKHGYTYGAWSVAAMEPSTGYLAMGADVQAEQTAPALREFLDELRRIRTGDISEEEAAKARETKRVERVKSFQGLDGTLIAAAELEKNNMPFTAMADDLAAISATTAGELNEIASDAIPLESALLVLVGDKQLLLEQLKSVDLPAPVEVGY